MEAYQGNPNNVTTPLTATITGASNTSPIVITTSPNAFNTGDTVLIAGVGGNIGANGTWTITVLTTSTFSLTGSSGTGAYTSGGTATDESITPAASILQDGTDNLVAANLNAAVSTALDRTQWLQGQILGAIAGQPYSLAFLITANGVGVSTIASVVDDGQIATCTTTANHYLQTGMTIAISGATGTINLNGTWIVTVTSSTKFTVPVPVTGSYTADSADLTPIIPSGCTSVGIWGWGGGGGGEGGGGIDTIPDDSATFIGTVVQGGGGAGAPPTLALLPVTPGQIWGVSGGLGGDGGAGATPSVVAVAGRGGDAITFSLLFGSFVDCDGGCGAGANQVSGVIPYLGDAVIAPGGLGTGKSSDVDRAWPAPAGIPGVAALWSASATQNNAANFTSRAQGNGGAAIVVYQSGPNPSTSGVGREDFDGGASGANGNTSGSSPTYLGGPGGGGGGAGPGGNGGSGGDGSNGNDVGSTGPGGDAPAIGGGGGSGAGGGGGGNAGAASGTTGNGGAGANGDTGEMFLVFFLTTPSPSTLI